MDILRRTRSITNSSSAGCNESQFFEGKVVLEGGLRQGGTKLAAQWGAEVVGIDLGDGVESAFALTKTC